jgi:hypothetical protein
MATTQQRQAARRNVKKAQEAAKKKKKTIAGLPRSTRLALDKQGAAVARRDLPGRSTMGRDELAKTLGER